MPQVMEAGRRKRSAEERGVRKCQRTTAAAWALRTVARSATASLRPCGTRSAKGCLPGLWQSDLRRACLGCLSTGSKHVQLRSSEARRV